MRPERGKGGVGQLLCEHPLRTRPLVLNSLRQTLIYLVSDLRLAGSSHSSQNHEHTVNRSGNDCRWNCDAQDYSDG